MAKLKFRTAMSALKKGGKACYQCVPVLENKVTEAGFLAEAAVIAGGNLPERSQWNPADGNSFLTKVVDAGGETLFEGREILDEDLGPATSSPSALSRSKEIRGHAHRLCEGSVRCLTNITRFLRTVWQ